MVRGRYQIIVLSVSMLAAVWAHAGCGTIKRLVTGGAAHHRQKWEASGVHSYRMLADIQKPGHMTPMGKYEILVRDGRFERGRGAGSGGGDIRSEPVDQKVEEWNERIRLYSYATIDNIFERIEAAEKVSNSRFEVEYHPTLGYPTYFHVDPSGSVMDDELLIKVIELEPLAP